MSRYNFISLCVAAAGALSTMSACSEAHEPVITVKDWDANAEYFASPDLNSFDVYFKPQVGFVGDPMPFYDEKDQQFKIFYLQDFRPNPVACYHPIYMAATKDGASYDCVGQMVGCGGENEQDAAIGTGSVIYNNEDNLYYCFYTGNKYRPTSAQNAQVVMYATSSDCRTWDKNRVFMLRGNEFGYDRNDFRDPQVFKGDDGKYHMLVATRKGGKGTIAEFVSSDCRAWTCAGDFMNMQWDRFYECPDVFKMGDWWYLVYSDQTSFMRMVQYFKGRTLDELKDCTKGDAGRWPDAREGKLDGRAFYAGKTASDGVNRYVWGWCPTRAGKDNANVGEKEPEWAGNLVMHRLIQHEDGRLTLGVPQAIDAKYTTAKTVKIMATKGNVSGTPEQVSIAEGAEVIFNRLERHSKISFDVKCSTANDRFAIEFVRGTDPKADPDTESWYSVHVNADENKANFEKDGYKACYLLDSQFTKPADGVFHVTVYTDQSVCVTYINDELSFTNRIYNLQKNPWGIKAIQGSCTVSNVKVSYF